MNDKIIIQGARENNLKNVNLTIPRDKLVVFTGLSGSGKSSLAFDTIYAEGQRRYVESLSSYARQFLGQMDKPDVDSIDGLSPAISIDQKTTSKNPRSTVGTVTEIYDYLRLLWARVGVPHCPKCGREIRRQTIDQIVDRVEALGEGTRFIVLSPVIRGKKGEHRKVLEDARKSGFARVRVDGILYDLTEDIPCEKNKKHTIELVVDRLVLKDGLRRRLTDSIETACSHSGGLVTIELPATGEELSFSQNYACEDCGISLTELEPRMFSFNNPAGACPSCTGLGFQLIADADLVIPDKNKSIFDGAIKASGWQSARTDSIFRMYFEALAQKYHFSLTEPVKNLPEDVMDVILYGTKGEKLRMSYNRGNGMGVLEQPFEGILNNISRRFRETQSDAARKELEECMATAPCPQCHGDRLSEIARAVTVGGIGIMDFCRMSVRDELEFMKNLRLEGSMAMVAEQIVKEIKSRLQFPDGCGTELSDALPLGGNPFRRREPAYPAGHPDRFVPDGRAVYSGRAVHRSAPAGQRQALGHAEAPAGFGQHPDRCRARRGHHARRRFYCRCRSRRWQSRRRDRGGGNAGGYHKLPPFRNGTVPLRREENPGSHHPTGGERQFPAHSRRTGEQSEKCGCVNSAGNLRLRHRRVRFGKVQSGQ